MKIITAIIIGIRVWGLAITAFILSTLVSIIENVEMQSNLALSIALVPILIVGTRFYYKKHPTMNPFLVGLIFLLTAISLDALVTVPFLIIPNGLGYADFFLTSSFWLIAIELFVVTFLTGKYYSLKFKH